MLSTTYDKTLKERIFVLRGSEAYARTTDVKFTIDDTFSDFNTHVSNCRIGLIIQVSRCEGDGYVFIYNNDEVLMSIPYCSENMDTIIGQSWNDKGVYWDDENQQLIVGTSAKTTSGLFLPYLTDCSLKVRYTGSDLCLGSTSKTQLFYADQPSSFQTTLSFEGTKSYSSGATVNALTLKLLTSASLSGTKSVKVYEGDTLLTTVSLTNGTASTLSISGLSDGKHTLKAVWVGDDECFPSEDAVDISIGYTIYNVTAPAMVLDDTPQTISGTVMDYLDNPITSQTIYIKQSGSNVASATSNSSGIVTFSNVTLSHTSFDIYYGNTLATYTPQYINPTGVDIVFSTSGDYLFADISCHDGNGKIAVENIPFTITTQMPNQTPSTSTGDTNAYGTIQIFESLSPTLGQVKVTATITGTSVTTTAYYDVYLYYWQYGRQDSYATPSLAKGTLTQVSNGWKLLNTDNDTYPVNADLTLALPTAMNQVGYKVSFIYRSGNTNGGIKVNGEQYTNIPANASVVFLKSSSGGADKYDMYVNNELRDTLNTSQSYLRITPYHTTVSSRKGKYIIFDSLRIGKVFVE